MASLYELVNEMHPPLHRRVILAGKVHPIVRHRRGDTATAVVTYFSQLPLGMLRQEARLMGYGYWGPYSWWIKVDDDGTVTRTKVATPFPEKVMQIIPVFYVDGLVPIRKNRYDPTELSRVSLYRDDGRDRVHYHLPYTELLKLWICPVFYRDGKIMRPEEFWDVWEEV